MKEVYFTKETILTQSEKIKVDAQRYCLTKELKFDKSKAALLITDMQKYFLKEGSHAFIPSAPAILPGIKSLIEFCNKQNIPIIYTRHINNQSNHGIMNVWWNDIITSGSVTSEILDELPSKHSQVIKKSQYDAFYNTDLEKSLKEKGKSQLIVCGVMTNLCCETTVRSAFIKGIAPFLPIDTTATYTFDIHLSTIKNLAFGFTQPLLSKEIITS